MKNNRINRKNKFRLAVLYLFILTVTTFHHHPFNLDTIIPFIETVPVETVHHFSADECPIINFSNTGFNSFGISIFNSVLPLENIFAIVPGIVRFSSQLFFNSFFLRAPPLKSI